MQNLHLIECENFFINNGFEDVVKNGNNFKGFGNFEVKKLTKNAILQANECEIEFVYCENLQTKDDIFSKFLNKNIQVFVKKNEYYKTIISGIVGEIKMQTGGFILEIISDLYKISKPMTKKYSQTCRASFCDENCQLKPENFANKTCDKTLQNCKTYQNVVNFQGEPFVLKNLEI